MMSTMALRGPTLLLRPPVAADAEALFALASDPEVTQWFSWGPYTSVDQPADYIERAAERRLRGEQLDLLIEHQEAGPIGITGLSEFSARDRRAMVGTWFGRDWWGTGANTESKALMFHLAFGQCGLLRVGAYSDVANERSKRALIKVGLRHEGVLRGWHRHGDVQKDVNVHGLLLSDWEGSELAAVEATLDGAVPEVFVHA
jgi:ribosomal-protein-alanine N-acetyltransferase